MDIQTEKLYLVKRLLDTDDESVLQEVKTIFEKHEKDFWIELPDHVKRVLNAPANKLKPVY